MRPIVCATGLAILILTTGHCRADKVSFQRQIRGILSDKCFACHGPDEEDRQADLRLDDETSAMSKLDSGATAVVPGDPAASELIVRILTDDADLKMPPADSGKQLSDGEIELLKRWVSEGASWGSHWAFVPVQRPEPPTTGDQTDVVNDIDRFVRAQLPQAGLTHNPPADRVSLIRRVTFDLTGLPPSPEEVAAFVNDASPDAYEKLVDRLLASPRYGEHMARYWLDAARYGDTHGLHLDNYREMWAYRDWVINAFNNNKPFDQFTIEQLAGDLLDEPTEDQLVATGFNRCHVTTSEGGSIAEEVHVRNVVDRVVTTGTVFMGLTLDCCRCHNHKFDPVTMKDFYSLYAYFNSIDGPPLDGNKKDHAPVIKVLTAEQKQQIAELQQQQQQLQTDTDAYLASIEYTEPEQPREPENTEPTEFVWLEDAVPAGASAQGTTPWQFAKAPAPVYSGETSSTRTATGLSQHFFDNAGQPITIAEGDQLFCYVHLDPANPPKQIMLQWNDGTWNHRAYWGENLIDWGTSDSPSRRRMGDLPNAGEWVRLQVKAADVGLKAGASLKGWAFTQFDGTVYWDKAGILSTADQQPLYDSIVLWERDQRTAKGMTLPRDVQAVLMKSPSERSAAESQRLLQHFLQHAYTASREQMDGFQAKKNELEKQIADIRNNAATTLIFKEAKQPKPAYVLNRGEYDQKRDEVPRAVPAVLPPLPQGVPNNRLGLAHWLTDSQHPLMSRVTINRFWQRFFGTGLVKTSEDFGSQGSAPSHPELLDWLCAEFMNPQVPGAGHNWDTKHIMKLMVMSATYRQSAHFDSQTAGSDPDNRLLARGPRFRLDAEMLRDQALFVSGLLVEKVGGPSVKPPQPDGLWFAVGYSGSNTVRFKQDEGHEKVHRRTLYTFIKRTAPPPQMSTFDAPSRESCVVRRERTNSPMQALMMMNDPQYVEAARALAERGLAHSAASPQERAAWMLQLCIQRTPTAKEVDGLADDYQVWRDDYAADPEAARKLISVGEVPAPDKYRPEELAAWTMVANVILNLDEVINK
jgi:hypothetical protein